MALRDTRIPTTHTVTHIHDLLLFLNMDKMIAMHRLINAGIRATTPAKLITENKTNNAVKNHKIANTTFASRLTPSVVIAFYDAIKFHCVP